MHGVFFSTSTLKPATRSTLAYLPATYVTSYIKCVKWVNIIKESGCISLRNFGGFIAARLHGRFVSYAGFNQNIWPLWIFYRNLWVCFGPYFQEGGNDAIWHRFRRLAYQSPGETQFVKIKVWNGILSANPQISGQNGKSSKRHIKVMIAFTGWRGFLTLWGHLSDPQSFTFGLFWLGIHMLNIKG